MSGSLGEKAAHLKWSKGLTWREAAAELGVSYNKARQAARRYKDRHAAHGLEQLNIKEEGNTLVLTSTSPLITSLDQLLEFCEVDLDVWMVERHIVNAWSVGTKHEEKNLAWQDGAIADGSWIKADGIVRFGQNIQVKAWLIRREPEPIKPTISPVSWSGSFREPEPPPDRPFVRHLVWGDAQIGFRRRVHDAKLTPFHDRRVLDLIAQIAAAAKPDQMHITGDLYDCTEWTDKFLRSPEFYFAFQPALCEGHWWLTQYVQLVSEVLMHQGNHELRLPDAVKRHLPFAYGLRPAHMSVVEAPQLLSFQYLLNLDELGIEWIGDYPNDRYWLAKRLALYHGNVARANPLDVARALAQFNHSIINPHNHRNESSTQIRHSANGVYTVWGYSVPCACHVDWRVPGHNLNQHWSQGLVQVDVYDFEDFYIQPIPIDNGRAIYDGKLFEARDRIEDLKEDLPEWNW